MVQSDYLIALSARVLMVYNCSVVDLADWYAA